MAAEKKTKMKTRTKTYAVKIEREIIPKERKRKLWFVLELEMDEAKEGELLGQIAGHSARFIPIGSTLTLKSYNARDFSCVVSDPRGVMKIRVDGDGPKGA